MLYVTALAEPSLSALDAPFDLLITGVGGCIALVLQGGGALDGYQCDALARVSPAGSRRSSASTPAEVDCTHRSDGAQRFASSAHGGSLTRPALPGAAAPTRPANTTR